MFYVKRTYESYKAKEVHYVDKILFFSINRLFEDNPKRNSSPSKIAAWIFTEGISNWECFLIFEF